MGTSCAAAIAALARLDRMEVLAAIPLEDGRLLGDCWDPWQREDHEAMGRSRHVYRGLPRGHDKTGGAGSEIVVEMINAPAESEIFSFAVDEQQAQILLRDVAGKLRRLGLVGRGGFRVLRNSVVAPNGTTFTAMAADAASAMGLRAEMIVVDELSEWPERAGRELWTAIRTTAAKRPRCRLLVITTAGWNRASLCWEVRCAAEREPRWLFIERGQCASWLDHEDIEEQRRSMPPGVFARLHLNQWVDQHGAWLSAEQVDAVFAHGAPGGSGRRVVALDIGVRRDRAAASVVRADDERGVYVVEQLKVWIPEPGADVDLVEVQEWVDRQARRLRCPITMDPWQGALMAQQLRAGPGAPAVHDDPITEKSRNDMFLATRDAVVQRRLWADRDEMLRGEMLAMEFEGRPGGARYRVNHPAGQHDDCVFSVALGVYWLGKPARRRGAPALGRRLRRPRRPGGRQRVQGGVRWTTRS